MIFFSGSMNPPTDVQMISVSASNPMAVSVASSSLSENFSSTLLTRSFSFIIGRIPFFQNSVKVSFSWRKRGRLEK